MNNENIIMYYLIKWIVKIKETKHFGKMLCIGAKLLMATYTHIIYIYVLNQSITHLTYLSALAGALMSISDYACSTPLFYYWIFIQFGEFSLCRIFLFKYWVSRTVIDLNGQRKILVVFFYTRILHPFWIAREIDCCTGSMEYGRFVHTMIEDGK